MTSKTTTIEPGIRILRTVFSVAIGVVVGAGGIVPGVLAILQKSIPANYFAEAAAVGGGIVAFSAGANALLNIPAVVKILPSWLTPTAITATSSAIQTTANDAVAAGQADVPKVAAVVEEAQQVAAAPTPAGATQLVNDAAAVGQAVAADAATVVADGKAVGTAIDAAGNTVPVDASGTPVTPPAAS